MRVVMGGHLRLVKTMMRCLTANEKELSLWTSLLRSLHPKNLCTRKA
jgi:hypothetical protein